MTDPVSLLPQNATPLMRAVSLANGERRPFAPAQLAELWDPATAPADILPYLAAAHGVSVWRADWSEDRKRDVIARSILLKRRRGTVPCFEAHLGFVDAELRQTIAAPQLAVVRSAMTDAERQAWLAQFPELRVYHFSHRARIFGVATPGRWLTARLTFRTSRATIYAGQRAVIIDRGEEREAVISADSETLRVGVPTVGRRMILGPTSPGFMVPLRSIANEQTYVFRKGDHGPDTLRPGLRPIDVAPIHVSARLAGVVAFVPGHAFAGRFRSLQVSRAAEAAYDSIRLYEPSRVLSGKVQRRAGLVPGHSRLGQPAFHLELAVDISIKRRKARRFPHMPGFIESYDPTRVDEALAAIRSAKLGRDKVEVRTALHRRITLGDRLPLNGSHQLGQIIRSL